MQGTRPAGTLRLLEIKVVELGIVDRASDSTIGKHQEEVGDPLSLVLVVAGKKVRRGRSQSLSEAWLGGRLRRLVLSVEVDWWHSRCSPTSQPLARSSSTLLFDPSKRPNPHGCKTSWRPEDLRGRFEIRELCPFHGH